MAKNTRVQPGHTYGRLTVVERLPNRKTKTSWKCQCSCGNTCEVLGPSLVGYGGSSTRSCGCLRKETAAITAKANTRADGMGSSPEYRIWSGMKNRCTNPNNKNWPLYGGRGIVYDPTWEDFAIFFADVGPRPRGTTLNRVDNDGPYNKTNCNWATAKEQANNRSSNKILSFAGERMTVAQFATKQGIRQDTLLFRIKAGWSVERALSTATRAYG